MFESMKDLEKIKHIGPQTIRIIYDKFKADSGDVYTKIENGADKESIHKYIDPELSASFIEVSVNSLFVCIF